MDILFIALGPVEATFSSSFRNRAIIKGFIELGHNVDVLTISPDNSYLSIKNMSALNGVNVIRINKVFKSNASVIIESPVRKRIVNLIRILYNKLFLFDVSYFSVKRVDLSILPQQQFDIIISSSDPKTSHILVDSLIRKGLKFNKWIQYWGDPLSIDITSKHIYPKFYTEHVESRILKGANKIIYVSPFTLIEQQNLFPKLAQKMSFLPIPYEFEKLYEKTENEKYVVGYFGYYVKGIRNIIPLYEAFMNVDNSLQLNIVGGSNIRLKSTESIRVFPISNNISEFERNCDLLVVILNSQGSQIPGKVYHAAATNKPVLVILDGEKKVEIRSYLEKYERFYFCENNAKNIADSIKMIIKRDKQFRPCKELSPKYIASSFLD